MVSQPRKNSGDADTAAMHLLAFDEDDIAIISAHLQDAITRVADITFIPAEKRFVLVTSRFDWNAAVDGTLQRRLAGLHFDHVQAVQRSGFDQSQPDAVLNLLSIVFDPDDNPSGKITLLFSAGAAIRLDVECIDAQLNDIGPGWRTKTRPEHNLTDDEKPAQDLQVKDIAPK